MINSDLSPISHRFRDTAIYSFKLSTKNCDQTAADKNILLTVYKKSPAPYPTVGLQSPTTYDLPFSHNIA